MLVKKYKLASLNQKETVIFANYILQNYYKGLMHGATSENHSHILNIHINA